tara:strand:+ start:1432 stop:2154 length:723 start_codon:yes stop_codon:yes gene_type:complete
MYYDSAETSMLGCVTIDRPKPKKIKTYLSVSTDNYYNEKKRKYDEFSNFFKYKLFDHNIYDSSLYCIDNHIYFNTIIDDYNINKLKNIILQLKSNYPFQSDDTFIYIHINEKKFKKRCSSYGYLTPLLNNIEIFKSTDIPLVSIAHGDISDIYIFLCALCQYSYIDKKITVTINQLKQNVWNNCIQSNYVDTTLKNTIIGLFNIITDNKIKFDKISYYLDNGFVMNAKKAIKNHLFSGII